MRILTAFSANTFQRSALFIELVMENYKNSNQMKKQNHKMIVVQNALKDI